MHTHKIVFVGGPGTGKSTTLRALKKRGYCCLEEVSRQVTLEAQKKGITQLFLEKPLLFSQKLLEKRIDQFDEAHQSTREYCFLDRGIPEVSAYMYYKNETVPEDFKKADLHYRYDQIFIFPIWDEIYTSDNERYETLDEAKEIQRHIKKSYLDLNYELVEVPKTTISERVDFILKKIDSAIS